MPNTARTHQCYECGRITDSSRSMRGYALCETCWTSRTRICTECGERHMNYDMQGDLCYNCAERLARWDAKPVPFDGDVSELRSTRRFGIELETSECTDYRKLRDKISYGAKYDGSISGMEFVSPILQGDKGLWSTRGFCTRAKHMGFKVNSDCGYHVHIDVSGNTPLQQRHIACAYACTYAFWCRLVKQGRIGGTWCRALPWEPESMATTYRFPQFCDRQNRYTWFNVNSLERHGTFEIRLHEGTLDSRTVCNWVKAHLRFADFVQDMKFNQILAMFKVPERKMWRAVTNTWDDPALRRYYRRVALGKSLDTSRVRGRV